jgi:hypothetical protein
MEDVMYSPSYRESQLICHRGDFFDDLEGFIPFGFELYFLMADFQVGRF